MPIDYSKWKSIEVSDDEDDTHPNIHTPALFRLRHQSRLEKMAAMKEAREELESNKQETSTRLQEIEDKLKNASIAEKERISLELEKQKINEEWEKYQRKERELDDKERLQPWNIDTIGHEAWSKTIVNKAAEKKDPPPAPAIDDDEDNRRMAQYFKDHEELMKQFAMLDKLVECENFLLEHPHLASDYAASYITIEALNLAMLGKEAEMAQYAANGITLQYLLEFAKTFKALATNTTVIKEYFKKFRKADPAYLKIFNDEIEAFKERLRKRALTKRDEMIEEQEAEEREKRISESPGGIDPQEVFDSLPEPLKLCFVEQSVDKIKEVAARMDREVFRYHMQRCIDSGLWVPNDKKDSPVAGEEVDSATVADDDAN